MLASAETITVVANVLRDWQERTGKMLEIVLDPVSSYLSIQVHS
jgi:hydroxymethylpyrimidine/phosphomethylpyrimidine kinase